MQVTQEEIFIKVVEALEKSGIDYMITGSIAAINYGVPRYTHDMDVVVVMDISAGKRLSKELESEFYIDPEAIIESIRGLGFFNIVHLETGLKVDFWSLKNTDFDRKSFVRRRKIDFFGRESYFIAPEDLILNKLLWYKQGKSSTQIQDIEGILKTLSQLDYDYIADWAEELSVFEIWKELIKK